MRILKLLIFLLFSILYSYSSFSATYSSAGSGSWNTFATWTPAGVPTSGDIVIINATHTVSIDAASTVTTLTIDGTLTIGTSPLTVTGNVNGTGAINQTGSTLYIAGDNLVATLNLSGGTVEYNGSGSVQQIRGGNYANLVLSGTASTKQLMDNSIVNYNLNIMAGTTFVLGPPAVNSFSVSGTTNIDGTFIFGNAAVRTVAFVGSLSGIGTLDMTGPALAHTLRLSGASNSITTFNTSPSSGSRVIYDGAGPQTVFPSPNYQNLIIQTSTSANLNGNIIINGGLDITPSSTLSAGNYNIDIHENWKNDGTFNSTATVNFVGSIAQMINGAATTAFYRMTVSKPSGAVVLTKEITSTITVINANNILDLRVTIGNNLGAVSGTGTLALSAPGGGSTSFPSGNFSAFLTSGSGIGTVEYNGPVSYTIDHTSFPAGEMYYNMVISGSGTKTLPDDAKNVKNNLSIQSGVTLNLTATVPLEVFTDFINFGTLNVSAASWLKVDSLLINNAGAAIVINGNIEAQGNVTNNGSLTGNSGSGLGFSGSANQTISGNQPNLWDFHIMKAVGSSVGLGCNVRVNGGLIFDSDGNILLNSSDLILSPTTTITTPGVFGPDRMIESNGMPGSGRIVKEANTDTEFLGIYPIGTSAGYSPLNISALTATLGGLSTIAMKPVMQTPALSDFIARYLQLETTVSPSDFAFNFSFVAPDKIGNPNKVYRYIGTTPNPVTGYFVGASNYGVLSGYSNAIINGDWKCLGLPPVINSLVPTSGCVGDSIDINGSNFLNATNVQFFSAVTAGFVIKADNLIRAKVPAGATTGNISVINPFGTGTSPSFFTVNSVPATPGTITGPNPVCAGDAGLIYSIGAVPGATAYNWQTVPTGSTITSGQGSTSITATVGSISGNFCVYASNSCGNSTTNCLLININPAPSANAGANQSICAGSTATISGTVTGATGGTWTTSGTGTFGDPNALSTTYNPTGPDITMGSVTLTLTTTGSGSCTAVSDQLILTITSGPNAALTISSASDTVCLGADAQITVQGSETGVSYQAKTGGVNAGAAIIGTGGNIILTVPNANLFNGPNTVNVEATQSGCIPVLLTGSSVIKKSDLTAPPVPGSITGTQLCNGTTVTLAAAGGYSNYQWYMNNSIVVGATTTSYNPVTATAYSIGVYDSLCKVRSGNTNVTTAGIDPIITASGNLLSVPGGATYYQWYVISPSGSRAIFGANGNSYQVFYNADYFVATNFLNCRLTSLQFPVNNGSLTALSRMNFQMNDSVIFILPPNEEEDVVLYPNPAEDAFTVNYKTFNADVVIELYNSMGNKVLSKSISAASGTIAERFENLNLQSGIYLVYIIDGKKKVVRTVQIN